MKPISTTLLPALALLTLGGCAGTSGLATTEPDGVYYSSKDRTTEVVTASTGSSVGDVAASDDPNAVDNPEYQDDRRSSARGRTSDEYYDDDYSYSARIRRFHQPYYRGLGMGYYDFAYVDPFWYNPAAAFYGYDAFGFPAYYGPRYGGFYDPFWGGYGGVNISIGFGYGWGGPWGYRPYRYGFGGYRNGFYDGYYAGMYGNPGYYGNGFGWNGYRNGGRNVNYGPRRERNNEALNSGGRSNGGRPRTDDLGGRVVTGNGNLTNGSNSGSSPVVNPRRPRVVEDNQTTGTGGGKTIATDRNTRLDNVTQTQEQPATGPGRGRLYRIVDTEAVPETGGVRTGNQPERVTKEQFNTGRPDRVTQNAEEAAPQETYTRPRRERVADGGGQPVQQPQQYERPARRERSYEAAPSRSYEAPRSNSGGNYGGGNSGGSSSGGSRGRGRVQ
ncbi:hypothetical protein [Hymenobacter koreensis]|uniref:DUF3300 domain-containing protein n=1 Tax=Hymenobacter koreensis TaxID=1084523 RepID=A0ABP8IXW9_9BACT